MFDALKRWDDRHIGDLNGLRIVITGGNSGVGLGAAKHLTRAGADVVIACRNPEKAAAALDEIRREVPGAIVQAQPLDLADLSSVQRFVESYLASGDPLDILVNNAGVMAPPLSYTKDGFEMQMGTNHLGHFALTLPLIPLLEKSAAPRIVVVGSHAHIFGRMNFENLNAERSYIPMREYSQSKLANLLFALELKKRLEASGSNIMVTAAHPGYSDTALQYKAQERGIPVIGGVMAWAAGVLGQPSEKGSLPTVRACVDPALQGGEYIGPRGLGGLHGYPVITWRVPWAKNEAVASRVWDVSETLTSVRWDERGALADSVATKAK